MTFQQFVRNLREKGYEVKRRGTLISTPTDNPKDGTETIQQTGSFLEES